MEHVILDTNFLLVPLHLQIDVSLEIPTLLGDCQLYTLDVCLNELRANGFSEHSIPSVEIIETAGGKPDEVLVTYGQAGYVIATNDRALRQRLQQYAVPVIFVRQRRYLVMG